MKLRTEIVPLKLTGLIDHSTRVVMVGSCFTDEIGSRLRLMNIDAAVNPAGTLFNPLTMATELGRALDAATGETDGRHGRWDLFSDGKLWHTFRRHSQMSMADGEAMAARLDADQLALGRMLCEADLLIATFGSAIGFRHKATGETVANCHKRPASEFERREQSVDEIVGSWAGLIKRLREVNPGVKLMMTISPVRHAGYGLVADRLSKSTLCLACHQLEQQIEGAIYYPSYEIFVDDLRDYRFYGDDLVHPSAAGVAYTMEHFTASTMTAQTAAWGERWRRLALRPAHRYGSEADAAAARAEVDAAARRLAREQSSADEARATEIYNRFTRYTNEI